MILVLVMHPYPFFSITLRGSSSFIPELDRVLYQNCIDPWCRVISPMAKWLKQGIGHRYDQVDCHT